MGFHVEKNTMVPMRDGTKLATDLWIPDGVTSAPVLLARLPYSKDGYPAAEIDYVTTPNIFTLLEAGYAIVYQDCRGTGMSEGRFVPIVHEADDGADTIAWLLEQSWCDGNIGSFGHSYLGMTQWATASKAPESLKAIATAVTSADSYLAPWYSPGGGLSWHSLWYWTQMMIGFPTNDVRDSARGAGDAFVAALEMLENAEEQLKQVPAINQPLYRELWSWWSDIIEHADHDDYWNRSSALARMDRITAPALHIGGWFDIFVSETTRAFRQARRESATEVSRSGRRMIIGPWDHNYMMGEYHDRQYGPLSSVYAADLTQAQLAFFDRHVRARHDSPETAPVRIFVMGVDEWREEQDWPLPDMIYVDYHLGSTSPANGLHGGGVLLDDLGAPGSERWVYDPMNPVPTLGGRIMGQAAANVVGPVDQRPVEERDDVLVFSTEPLKEAVEVIGEICAILYVASAAVDTAIMVKLVDVDPGGRAIYLTDGMLRLRYRHSLAEPELLTPGRIEQVTIEVGPTANVFLPDHRIRVEISSSNFPRYDRNMNTAALPAMASNGVSATNVVYHGADHPSRIILPVSRRADERD